MENSYESGFAFVLEGATERVFYERLLYFFARKHPNCSIEKNQDSETFETFFTVRGPFGVRIIKMNAVGGHSWHSPASQFSKLVPKQLCPSKGKENSMDGFSLL